MDRNIGGTSLPSLSGVTLNGSNYSSGWGKSYNYNDSSLKATVVSLETFDCTPYKYKGRDINTKKADIAPKPASIKKAYSALAGEPIKQFGKDWPGLISSLDNHKNWTSIIGVGSTFVATFGTESLAYLIEGKKYDFTKILAKSTGKAASGLVNYLGSVVSIFTKDANGKHTWSVKQLDKFVLDQIWNEKAAFAKVWNDIGANPAFSSLTVAGLKPQDTLKPKDWVKLFKNPELKKDFISARKALYSNMLEDMFKGGWSDGVKILGSQMAVAAVFDYGFSLIGNFVGNLIQGKSFAEAISMENMHYGQEALKSVNKIVWTYAGKFIGYAIGNPKVGQIVGALIGSIINNWICEPFRQPNGDIDETACAIAAGAELVGAIAGVAIAIWCCGPVGWAIGLGILIGAAFAYGITVFIYKCGPAIAKWVSEAVETVGQWLVSLGATISSGWQSFTKWASDLIDAAGVAINNAVVAVRDWASNAWNDVKAAVVNGVTTVVVAVGDFFLDLRDGIVWLWDQLTGWVNYIFA